MYVAVRVDHTDDGISYLRNKPQDPLGPPYFPPHTNNGHCTRVSCEYAAAIYLCNDNDHGVQVPTATIADYAQAVLNDGGYSCHYWDSDFGGSGLEKDVAWGQAFDVNGWLVFLFPFCSFFSFYLFCSFCLGPYFLPIFFISCDFDLARMLTFT